MGQTLSFANTNSKVKARDLVEHLATFLKTHCEVADGEYTPFYTLCSAFYTFLSMNNLKNQYTHYDLPGQILNLLRLYESIDPRVKCRGFTEGIDPKTYDCLTVWNVRIASSPA